MKNDPKRKVWIVKPLCHGNGGWYGFSVLSSKKGMQLKRALAINPYLKYNEYNDWDYLSSLGAIRICHKPDPNYTLFKFNGEEYKWEI